MCSLTYSQTHGPVQWFCDPPNWREIGQRVSDHTTMVLVDGRAYPAPREDRCQLCGDHVPCHNHGRAYREGPGRVPSDTPERRDRKVRMEAVAEQQRGKERT